MELQNRLSLVLSDEECEALITAISFHNSMKKTPSDYYRKKEFDNLKCVLGKINYKLSKQFELDQNGNKLRVIL